MLRDRWFQVGLVGAIVAAVCCFTPLAVIVLGALGLAAYAFWLDLVLLPALIMFVGICLWSFMRRRRGV